MPEIEVKHPLADTAVEPLRRKLGEIGAVSAGSVFERNFTYDDDRDSLGGADRMLRLRQAGRVSLTYKGPREQDAKFKNRDELEVEVGDFATAAAILDRLGFRPKRRYEKRRETWHWHDAELLVDELPFGWFLEIEGAPEDIEAVETALSLDPFRRSTKNYYEIYDDYCRERGLPPGDIVFTA